jgi:CDP-paratose 2-epimerase
MLDKEITVYGNGVQIRDVLHVDDLVRAYQAVIEKQDQISGQSFNIGGGTKNTLSLLELLERLRTTLGKDINLRWDDWRPGDQPVFVCDVSKAKKELGWQPTIDVDAGVLKLIEWVKDHSDLFA